MDVKQHAAAETTYDYAGRRFEKKVCVNSEAGMQQHLCKPPITRQLSTT